MAVIRVLMLAILIAAATMFLGWWSVPLVAAGYALLRRDVSAPLDAAIAALVAWCALLASLAFSPGTARLLQVLGGIFPVPAFVLFIVAALFATALAWSAARCVVGLGANRKSVVARVNQR